MSGAGLSVRACLDEISVRLTDAAAISRAAVVCAESGSEREAVRIALDLDEQRRDRSGRSSVTVKRKRSAETEALIVGGCTPLSV